MKEMLKMIFALLFLMCMTALIFCGCSKKKAFDRTAKETVDDILLGWSLGNSLESTGGKAHTLNTETSWGNPKTTKELLDLVSESGVNTIRIPVTWFKHMDENNVIDEEWLNRVEEIVGYVMEHDLYCIINVHHDTGENGWLRASANQFEENKAKLTAIWEQVARRFEPYGDKLLFEGFNEILDDQNNWVNTSKEALDLVNELNQTFVTTVRALGGNNAKRCLIINTYAASGSSAITDYFKLPQDTASDKIIVEAHVYQPYYFTADNFPDVTTWDDTELKKQIANLYTTFVKAGIPVLIGEFGCADKNNDEQVQSWAEYYVSTCNSYGIKCIWWDNGAKYQLFDRRKLTITKPDLLDKMLTAAKSKVNGGK